MGRVSGALCAAVLLVAFVGVAIAAEGSANASGAASGMADAGQGGATGQVQSSVNAGAEAKNPDASRAVSKLKAIRARANKMAAREREAVERRLSVIASDVDIEVFAKGEANVAERLSSEFQMTSEDLASERAEFGVGWGELMVAHTLLASSGNEVTLEQLFDLNSGGLGWGQIAYGLGLRGSSFVSAAGTQSLVARGHMESDGRPARIESSTYASNSFGAGPVGGTAGVGAAGHVTVGPISRIVR